MTERIFENAEIEITCPGCSHRTKQTVGWLRNHEQMRCGGCGSAISLENEEFKSAFRKADEAVEKFRRTLGKFGKR